MKSPRSQAYLVVLLSVMGFSFMFRQWKGVQLPASASIAAKRISLEPGELPGYTGWARPSSTEAAAMTISPNVPSAIEVGNAWKCEVLSPSQDSWMYVRAYGPAIVAGKAVPTGRGYQVSLPPLLDPGTYTVEVVVTFSHVPLLDKFPMDTDVFYDGYLVPGFPRQLEVMGNVLRTRKDLPLCKNWFSPSTRPHRWRVVKTVRQTNPGEGASPIEQEQPLRAYQRGITSSGFEAVYDREDCYIAESLPWSTCVQESSTPKMEIVLIGDSTFRLQGDMLAAMLKGLPIRVLDVELYGGIFQCFRKTGPSKEDMLNVFDPNIDRRVVLFNSGLHDIHRLCGREWKENRKEYLSSDEQKLPCTSLYRQAIRELAAVVQKIPSHETAFVLTQSSWPKYGNYGISWNPVAQQALPLDAGMIDHFNKLAEHELRELGIKILHDGSFDMTHSRPDHRQVNRKAEIGKKLSHAGIAIVEELARTWVQFMFQSLCQNS